MRIARILEATNLVTEILYVNTVREVSPVVGEVLLAIDTQLDLNSTPDSVIILMIYNPVTRKLVMPPAEVSDLELNLTVRNLKQEDQDISIHSFTSRDVSFTWDPPLVEVTAGFPEMSWLQSYKVEILNPNSSVRRTEYTTVGKYVYYYTTNKADGVTTAAREFSIKVTPIDMISRPFASATFAVDNLAPPAL